MVRFLLIGFLALALAGEAEARGCGGRFPRLRAAKARVVHPFSQADPCGECDGGGSVEAAESTARLTPVRTVIPSVAEETFGRARAFRSGRSGCPCVQ